MNIPDPFVLVVSLIALYLAGCIVAIIYAPWWLAAVLASPVFAIVAYAVAETVAAKEGA